MLFNSSEFLLFLPIVFTAYWLLNRIQGPRGLKWQNLLLLVASYVFYGWWDWRFLGLIAFSTVVDYFVGLRIAAANKRELGDDAPAEARSWGAKRWLAVSLIVNLGLLGYFKYANFFIENWIDVWSSVGVQMNPWSLKVILPVGISFYTFQTLSYSIDIYRRQLTPTRDLIEFAAFVSFFPQLVAGPIERASKLLPQIQQRRTFDYDESVSGLRLILWGMFKKVLVADSCAIYVNDIFANYQQYSGPTLILGAVYFAFQIYGDFSGYSDIAIGTARLFGIRLMTNFRAPYFSRDIAEFWRRWHISLSTWFRDYLYIPLGGSRVGKFKAVRNTFVIFLVSGFWHGANWTFIVWGGIHALLFLPLLLVGRNRRHIGSISGKPRLQVIARMAWTFAAVTVAWVFFRAESVTTAFEYIKLWLRMPTKTMPITNVDFQLIQIVALMLATELALMNQNILENFLKPQLRWLVWLGYYAIIGLIATFEEDTSGFIYFQF